MTERALFDLSARTKLRLTGADRLRYLNGQISNDLRKASETRALHACVLTAKGRISAEVFIVAEGESFLLDSDAGMNDSLGARLERYIIADDVQVADVTEEFALLHVLGATRAELPTELGRLVEAERWGAPGVDVWCAAAQRAAICQRLAADFPLFDEAAGEALRIARGLPRWGAELSEEIIPNEANLEAATVDYAKGCYIGQEVISRIKMSGQTNKRLCGLRARGKETLRPGMKLWLGEKEVGWVTSVSADGQALGFVKRGFWEVGSELEAREAQSAVAAVEVAALPFR